MGGSYCQFEVRRRRWPRPEAAPFCFLFVVGEEGWGGGGEGERGETWIGGGGVRERGRGRGKGFGLVGFKGEREGKVMGVGERGRGKVGLGLVWGEGRKKG